MLLLTLSLYSLWPSTVAMAVGPMLWCLYRISLLREVTRLFSSLGLGGSAVVSWITPPEITRLVLFSGNSHGHRCVWHRVSEGMI